jgi:hypothetical protein
MHKKFDSRPPIVGLVAALSAAASMYVAQGMLLFLKLVIYNGQTSWGLIGFGFPTLAVSFLIVTIPPFFVLKRLYGKIQFPVLIIGLAVLALSYEIARNYQMHSSQSLLLNAIIMGGLTGTAYLLASLTLPKLKRTPALIIAGVTVVVLAAIGPLLIASAGTLGSGMYQRSVDDHVTNLPYRIYGPTAADFELRSVKSTYEQPGQPSHQVDLNYHSQKYSHGLTISQFAASSKYDPPRNCVKMSNLGTNNEQDIIPCWAAYTNPALANVYTINPLSGWSNYRYLIKQGNTQLVVGSVEQISEAEMVELVSTLREVPGDHLKDIGISCCAGP